MGRIVFFVADPIGTMTPVIEQVSSVVPVRSFARRKPIAERGSAVTIPGGGVKRVIGYAGSRQTSTTASARPDGHVDRKRWSINNIPLS